MIKKILFAGVMIIIFSLVFAEAGFTRGTTKTANLSYSQKIGGKKRPTPSPTPSASATPLPSASATPLPSASATPLPSASATPLPSASPTPTPSKILALWVWHDDMMYDPAKKQAFISWAQSQNINRLYFNAYAFIINPGSIAEKQLADFIKTTPFQFELLIGEHEWTYTKNHATVIDLAQKAGSFVQKYGLQNKVSHLHLDVEADTLPEWSTDEAGISAQYLTLLSKVQTEINKTNLKLNTDIPNWYEYSIITYNGVNKELYKHIMDLVNETTIMDYIDSADKTDGMIGRAANELAYAVLIGKKTTIGAETNNLGGSSEQYTFFEEGKQALLTAFSAVESYFSTNQAFNGMAIHDYFGYKNLKP